jgi:hypothetical protein
MDDNKSSNRYDLRGVSEYIEDLNLKFDELKQLKTT